MTGAHRLAYELVNGAIPEGMVVMHTCDNPPCCNPRHLILGQQCDNIKDMIKKGRNVTRPKGVSVKFSDDEIKEIRQAFTGQKGQKFMLSKKYHCSPSTITNILNNYYI